MKAVVQRVSRASVSVKGQVISAIEKGLAVLVGVRESDSEVDAHYLAEKIANLRILPDQEGRFNLSVLDTGGEVLVVSQFTLIADTRRGRRPSFTAAAVPQEAESLIEEFVRSLRQTGLRVVTGQFQEYMLVEIHNDGPVTIVIDSEEQSRPRRQS